MIDRLRQMQGEPRFVARGMAAGIFIAITPTIPLHTVLAILLAFGIRGSKPAAILGVWVSNPVTIPIFYYACYKVGLLVTGTTGAGFDQVMGLLHFLQGPETWSVKFEAIRTFARSELHVLWAMQLGGVILGLPPAIAGYFLTLRMMKNLNPKARAAATGGNS